MTEHPGEPELVVLADPDAVAAEAARRIADMLVASVEARGRADWVTTGGSLAPPIYRRLAASPLRDLVPWTAVHVWWGDDRYVPRDHPLSNVKPFDDIMLAIYWTQGGQVALGQSGEALPVPIPIVNLHPFPTTMAIGAARGAAWCATQLAQEVDAAGLERSVGLPVFDLVVVGVGADGHLLSVFPGSTAFASSELALAVPAPTHIEPHVERVTLSPGILQAARAILLVATGEPKAAVLRGALRGDEDPSRLPARLARRGNAVWILDNAAAGEVRTQPDEALPDQANL
jgi:6-phosphogluconolactonase